MTLLVAESLHKHYGPRTVLAGADLQVDPGARLGVVGRNGTGKTTLLRLLAGLEPPDGGRVILRKGARLGMVAQTAAFAPGESVRAVVAGGQAEARRAVAELERVSESLGRTEAGELERRLAEQQRLTERVEALGGWEADRRIEVVLSGLGVAPELWDREASTLSGGEKSRVALARELVGGHDVLLLDEPTNHLDLEGIEWIEAWLRELPSAVVLVSHDRRLLDNAVTSIVELERGRLARYPGSYSRYVELKEERYRADLRAFEEQQDVIRKEQAFIAKHMGSQRTAEAKGRRKRLDSLERLERPYHDVRRPVIRPPSARDDAERGGQLVLEASELAGGYGDNVLFAGAGLRVGRGQRVGVVGRNGAGKTTLLRILAGRQAPLAGTVEHGHRAACGWFDQEAGRRLGAGTVLEIARRAWSDATDLELRSHLARFLFRGADVDVDVEALSGGERSRLALALLVLQRPTWLALDEPTNHLDLPARTALEEMLGEFPGALLCVSHDRAFLDGLCRHVVSVEGGAVRWFDGTYTEWRRAREAERAAEDEARARRAAPRAPAPPRARDSSPADGKIRNPYLFQKLEERIIELEEELAGLHDGLACEDVYRDPGRLKETQVRIAEVERELAEANERWENWS